jgi:HTH-type transcriptional regulator, competence development regulator
MKIEITKEWGLRMARLEVEAGADMEIGGTSIAATLDSRPLESSPESAPEANIAFGRFVRLMRRRRRQTVENLAEVAEVEITELVEIEEDNHHKPEPRTVYQLAKHFEVPMPKMMQLAGLSAPKDAKLYEEAIRFAARSETVEELNDIERAALEAFVSVLSEKK